MQLGIAELSSKDSEALRIPPHDIAELASCSKIARECKGKVSEPRWKRANIHTLPMRFLCLPLIRGICEPANSSSLWCPVRHLRAQATALAEFPTFDFAALRLLDRPGRPGRPGRPSRIEGRTEPEASSFEFDDMRRTLRLWGFCRFQMCQLC